MIKLHVCLFKMQFKQISQFYFIAHFRVEKFKQHVKNWNNIQKKNNKKIKEYNPLYVHFTDIMLTKKSFSWHNNNNIFASDYIICKHKF